MGRFRRYLSIRYLFLRYLFLASIVLPAGLTPALAQAYDFEDGLDGWTPSGSAFASQPVDVTGWKAKSIANIKLGGDYWKNTNYAMGQHGRFLVTSAAAGDAATGTLTSPEFTLDRARPYFSLRVGGTKDAAHELVELEVRTSAPGARDGVYLLAYSFTGSNVEAMRQETVLLPDSVLGLPARIRIVDDSPIGHITADDIQFTASEPPLLRTPVWGYADYHTHPMSYLAFGGLKIPPVLTIFGRPGGSIDDYMLDGFRWQNVSQDLPYCPPRHDGGYMAEQFINEAQILPDKLGFSIWAFLFPHGKSGGPDFKTFPSHVMGAHEQMHITQIRRNYDGGLRLMVALAEDNMGAEALTSYVKSGHVELAKEKDSVQAQLTGMKLLAFANRDWMQIAYSSDDARQIIAENKLAVILGVEVDQLGSYGFASPEEEVDWLWDLGVRAVTPIHAADNKIGGASLFEPAYNWLNDLLNRKADPAPAPRNNYDATTYDVVLGAYKKAEFFHADFDVPCTPQSVGECVMYHFGSLQFRVSIQRPFYTLFRPVAWILAVTEHAYDNPRQLGQKNSRGLTEDGPRYLAALMDKGMILDTAHMSERSVRDTYGVIGQRLLARRPDCPGFAFDQPVSASCDADAYPAIISHAHFRAQAIYDASEPISGFLPSEYDIGDKHLEMVRRTGGVVGPFITEARISKDAAKALPEIDNDCGMSSKNYAFSFHYALSKLGGGVGMATDFTFIPTVVPRFGPDACKGYEPYKDHASQERSMHAERYRDAGHRDQRKNCGIDYKSYKNRPQPKDVTPCGKDPLEPYGMDSRIYDFNVDGLAHFGLVPDMLQDLSNLGLPQSDLDELFSSAEGYLKMWGKVERLKGAAPQHP